VSARSLRLLSSDRPHPVEANRVAASLAVVERDRLNMVRVVASNARDADDCRMLLDVLGIDLSTIAAARTGAARTVAR
jgi:hypothetical protein